MTFLPLMGALVTISLVLRLLLFHGVIMKEKHGANNWVPPGENVDGFFASYPANDGRTKERESSSQGDKQSVRNHGSAEARDFGNLIDPDSVYLRKAMKIMYV